jgi:hypothetical protein
MKLVVHLADWNDAERNGDGTALETLLTDDFIAGTPEAPPLPGAAE